MGKFKALMRGLDSRLFKVKCQLCFVSVVDHGTPLYGHANITDSFVCPDEKLIHFFKKSPAYYGHPLIRPRTPFHVPSEKLS